MSASERLVALGIDLPPVAAPVAAYVPATRAGGLVVTSGQLPMVAGALTCTGLVGRDVDMDTAVAAARTAGLNAVAAASSVVGGIDRIGRVVKVVVYVASDPTFTQQAQVANGVSLLVQDVFGDAGVHARSAIGVAVLPLGAPVEVELTVAPAEPF